MRLMLALIPIPILLLQGVSGGLLGAGFGAGSCAAFPFRSDDLDHVGGCPRYSECCTEYGYCHSKDSWEKGYFRDCNGVSNGSPLPGDVFKAEALAAAQGDDKITAEMLGISEELWQTQIQQAIISLTTTTTTQLQDSSTSTGSQGSSFSTATSGTSLAGGSSTTLSSSDLVAQIILALQPQITAAVQTTIKEQSTTTNSGSSFGSSGSSFGSSGSSLGTSGSSFGTSGSSFGSSGSLTQGAFGAGQSFNSAQQSAATFGSSANAVQGTFGQSSQSSSLDTSKLIALIVEQLKPQIQVAVQNAV